MTQGQSIDQTPILSIFLEPRSLVITTDELYSKHLHGIAEITVDHFKPHKPEQVEDFTALAEGHLVANWELVEDDQSSACLGRGGSMPRGTRISLTCRDVEKVVPAKVQLLGRR